ncbi:hypothetical protein LP419_07295 [Massilia sp. H-1]|nr:hypothetical protein LP419_07295 [Massilia sp. H-1]
MPGIRQVEECTHVAEKIIEALSPKHSRSKNACCTSRRRSASACIRTTAATSRP